MKNINNTIERLTKSSQIILQNKYLSKILFVVAQLFIFVYIFVSSSIICYVGYRFLLRNELITTEQYEIYGFSIIFFLSFYLYICFKIFKIGNYFKNNILKFAYLTLFIYYSSDIFNFFIIVRWEWFLSILLSIIVYAGFVRTRPNFDQEKLDKLVIFLLPIFIFSSFIGLYYLNLFAKNNNFYELRIFDSLSSFILVNNGSFFIAPLAEEILFRGFFHNKGVTASPESGNKILLRRFGLIFFITSLFLSIPQLLTNYLRPLGYSSINNKIELSSSLRFVEVSIGNLLYSYNSFRSEVSSTEYLDKLNEFSYGYLEFDLLPFLISLLILIFFSNSRIRVFFVRIKDFLIKKSKIIAKIYHIISYPFIDFFVNKNNMYMYAISTIYFALIHLRWHNLNYFEFYYNVNYILASNLHIVFVFILALFALWLRVRINLLTAIAIHSFYNVSNAFVGVNFVSRINNIEYNTYMIGLMVFNISIILWFLLRRLKTLFKTNTPYL